MVVVEDLDHFQLEPFCLWKFRREDVPILKVYEGYIIIFNMGNNMIKQKNMIRQNKKMLDK